MSAPDSEHVLAPGRPFEVMPEATGGTARPASGALLASLLLHVLVLGGVCWLGDNAVPGCERPTMFVVLSEGFGPAVARAGAGIDAGEGAEAAPAAGSGSGPAEPQETETVVGSCESPTRNAGAPEQIVPLPEPAPPLPASCPERSPTPTEPIPPTQEKTPIANKPPKDPRPASPPRQTRVEPAPPRPRSVKSRRSPAKQPSLRADAATPQPDTVTPCTPTSASGSGPAVQAAAVGTPATAHAGQGAPGGKSASPGGGRLFEGAFGAGNGPRFARRISPQYPRQARRMGKEGTVTLRLSIDERGHLQHVELLAGAGPDFEEAALAAVRASRYHPARHNGAPVPSRALLTIRFALRDE